MNGKNLFFVSAVILFGLTSVNSVEAQNSATANASAIIVTTFTIEKTGDLNFGFIFPSNATGTVTVGADGSRTFDGGVTLIGTTFSAAAFMVIGEADATFSVKLPKKKVSLTNSSGEKMKVHSFSHSAGTTPTITSGGTSFNVGATIDVSSSQPAGVYNGTFDVTVTFH